MIVFRMNISRLACVASISLAFGAIGGCGADQSGLNSLNLKLYPVKGQVALSDGKPLTSGVVEFVPTAGPAISSTGEVGADGSFSLKTEGVGEGAPAGEYRVRILPDEAGYTSRAKKNNAAKSFDSRKFSFNSKFLDEDLSGLTALVKPEENKLEPFRLTK